MIDTLWKPIGWACTRIYRAANRLAGATPTHCALGFFLAYATHLAAEIIWADSVSSIAIETGTFVICVPLTWWLLGREARDRVAFITGSGADPVTNFRRLFVVIGLGLTVYRTVLWREIDSGWWFYSAFAMFLIQDDNDNGEPVIQRAWNRVRSLVVSLTPAGVTS